MKTIKRLTALALALILTLALAACGSPKTTAVPAPDATVDAMLAFVLKNDPTRFQTLYGYATPADAIDEQLDGLTVYDALMDGLVEGLTEDGYTPNQQALGELADSILALLARVPYSCATAARDDEAGTATVTITVDTLPADAFGEAMTDFAAPILIENLTKLTDEQAAYDMMLDILSDYFDQLQPTGQTTTLDVELTLTTTTVNGKEHPSWGTDDESEALGQDVMTAIFGAQLFG